jgi:hypothetical protein
MRQNALRLVIGVTIVVVSVITFNNSQILSAKNDTTIRSSESVESHFTSAYLVPSNIPPLFSEPTLQQHQIQTIHRESLSGFTSEPQVVDILYIHPSMLHEIQLDWLQNQYQLGTVIVAIDVPIRMLAKTLGVETVSLQDYLNPEAPYHVAYMMERPNTYTGKYTIAFTDAVYDINRLPMTIKASLQSAINDGAIESFRSETDE